MAHAFVSDDEMLEIYRESERERSKMELRIERLEHELARRSTKTAGEFAKRIDFERHLDAFDELVSICKRQQKMIEFLFFAIDLDPNGEDFEE